MATLPLPAPGALLSPGSVLGAGRSLVGWVGEVVDLAGRLPSRVDEALDDVAHLLTTLSSVAERVDVLVGRAEGIVVEIDGVVGSARTVAAGAGEVVEKARSVADGADRAVGEVGVTGRAAAELLELYRPPLERGAPLARHFVDELSESEVDAGIRLVDQLPRFTEHMVTDIMPILETFDRVGPDLHELLQTTKELRQAIDGIPGLGFLKKRGAAKDDDDTADAAAG